MTHTIQARAIHAKNGKQLWRVDITRECSTVIYVLADSEEAAREDADNLAIDTRDGGWDEIDDSTWVQPALREPDDKEYVWTGGPDGQDEPWEKLK